MSKNYKKKESNDSKQTSSNTGKKGKYSNKKQTSGQRGSNSTFGKYYLNDTQLITSAAEAVGYPAGTSFTDSATSKGMSTSGMPLGAKAIPGIAALWVSPHVSVSRDADSALNTAAKKMYTSFTFANGRSPSYQSSDTVVAAIAVGQAYAMVEFAKRAYRVLNTYSGMNRYFPEGLFYAMGLDYSDFKEHIADLAAWLVKAEYKMETLYVPSNFPLIEEWASMFRDIYWDNPDNIKAQVYVFVPKFVWAYNATQLASGGGLDPVTFVDSSTYSVPYKFRQFVDFIDALIDVLIYDDDINKIMADIRLAYGVDSVLKSSPVELGVPLAPVFDPVVLYTIHNSTIISDSYATLSGVNLSSESIYQVNNVLYHKPCWSADKDFGAVNCGAIVFDVPSVMDGPLFTLACTRMSTVAELNNLAPNYDYENETGYSFKSGNKCVLAPRACGVASIDAWFTITRNIETDAYTYIQMFTGWNNTITGHNYNMLVQSNFTKFSEHPIMHAVENNVAISSATGPSDWTLINLVTDLDNYTIIREEQLKKMHDAAIMSLCKLL